MNRSRQLSQRQVSVSSWPALDAELAVAEVEGAGVVPLDGVFDEADDGAAGAGAGAVAAAAAAAAVAVSCVGAEGWAGATPDMVRAQVLPCFG